MQRPDTRIPATGGGPPRATGTRLVSVVIPAKNEAANIGWVLDRLPSIVDEVVLVDGDSVDGTVEVARARRPDIVVVTDRQPGKGAAVRAGVAASTGDVVVMLDADGSMDPREIERFVQPLLDGHELCRGSRFLPGAGTTDMSPLRDVGNRVLLGMSNLLFGTSRTDLCYGYAAFRRDAFHGLQLTADGFEIEAQLFLRAERMGLRVVEVPSFEAPRRNGTSNLNTFRDGWRVFRTVIRERLRPGVPRSATGRRMTEPRAPDHEPVFALATAPVADLSDEALEAEIVGLGTAEAAAVLPGPTWPEAEEPTGRSRHERRPRWSQRTPIPVPSATQESPR